MKILFGVKTGLPGLLPLLGFYHLWRTKKLRREVQILCILPLVSFILQIFNYNTHSLLRTIQLLGIILLFSATDKFEKVLRGNLYYYLIIILSVVTLLIEYFFFVPNITHYMPSFLRFNLIVGEPNYSAFIILISLTAAFDYKKPIWIKVILSLLVCLTMSRMGILGLFVLLFLVLLKSKTIKKFFTIFIFVMTVSYPLLHSLAFSSLNDAQIKKVSQKQTRFYIHHEYIGYFLKNPFGRGYFNSKYDFRKDYYSIKDQLTKKYGVDGFEFNEHHNTLLQILCDFGLLGGLTWIFFLSLNLSICIRKNYWPLSLPIFLLCSNILNTLNDLGMVISLITPLIYAASYKQEKPDTQS